MPQKPRVRVARSVSKRAGFVAALLAASMALTACAASDECEEGVCAMGSVVGSSGEAAADGQVADGQAGGASDAAPAEAQPRAVRVSEVRIAGPAAGADPGSQAGLGSEWVPARLYEPDGRPWATLVWAHGGSFLRGTLDWPEADWAAQRFAEAGIRVYSVDYALASDEVKAPAPANDVAAVLRRAAEKYEGPLIVGGASAGAHLATLAALQQADAAASTAEVRDADALILLYPTLHRVQREDPAIAAATRGLPAQRRFDAGRIAEMYDFYLGDPRDDAGLVAGELPEDRLAQLPPTVVVNADADDLRASGEQFAEQLREAGVPVSEAVQSGTLHGYLNRPEESDRARLDAQQTIDRFVAELRGILGA